MFPMYWLLQILPIASGCIASAVDPSSSNPVIRLLKNWKHPCTSTARGTLPVLTRVTRLSLNMEVLLPYEFNTTGRRQSVIEFILDGRVQRWSDEFVLFAGLHCTWFLYFEFEIYRIERFYDRHPLNLVIISGIFAIQFSIR